MPEMPEVQGLVDFLRTCLTGLTITRVTVANIAALKTYDPPVEALKDAEITGAARHGKFIDLVHGPDRTCLPSRQGGLAALVRPARRDRHPAREDADRAARRARRRVGVRPDRGRHQEVARRLCRARPADVPGIARLGPDPLDPDVHPGHPRGAARRPPHADQGRAARPDDHRRRRQRLLRRDPARREDLALRPRGDPERRRGRHASSRR